MRWMRQIRYMRYTRYVVMMIIATWRGAPQPWAASDTHNQRADAGTTVIE